MIEAVSSRLGRVLVEGNQATLCFERRLPHPVERVWEAITDPEELSKWYLPESKVEQRAGGGIEYSSVTGHVTGKVLVWNPPHVFEHEWIVDRQGSPKGEYGIIRWELESAGNDTILKLTHRRLPAQIARYFAPGVHAILDRLEAHLDKNPLPDWEKSQEELRSSYVN